MTVSNNACSAPGPGGARSKRLLGRLPLVGDDHQHLGALRPHRKNAMRDPAVEHHGVPFPELDGSMGKGNVYFPLHHEQHLLASMLGTLIAWRLIERRIIDERLV